MTDGVAPSTWNLILTDCYNTSVSVEVLMRNGEKFTGYVQKHPAKWLHNVVQVGDLYGRVVHSIDVTEVAAVTTRRRGAVK